MKRALLLLAVSACGATDLEGVYEITDHAKGCDEIEYLPLDTLHPYLHVSGLVTFDYCIDRQATACIETYFNHLGGLDEVIDHGWAHSEVVVRFHPGTGSGRPETCEMYYEQIRATLQGEILVVEDTTFGFDVASSVPCTEAEARKLAVTKQCTGRDAIVARKL